MYQPRPQDGSVKAGCTLTGQELYDCFTLPECKKRLQDRIDMWSYAAKVAPAEGFSDLAVQVMTSPSKNYILFMIALSVCVLFLVGLLCGRITKRVTRELKDR